MSDPTTNTCENPMTCHAPTIDEATSGAPSATATTERRQSVRPAADVWETADAAHIACDVPGADAAGLDLRIEDDLLTLTARTDVSDGEGRAMHAEWLPRDYHRSFRLGSDLDRDRIAATLEHGVLHVTLPKRSELRPRSIPVNVSA